MIESNHDLRAIDPVPEPKPIGLQRVAAVVLILGGAIAIAVGLFMPWFSIDIRDLGGSAGAMLDFSDGPEDAAWTSIGDIATLILLGAACAVAGAGCIIAGSFGAGHPSRDRLADYLAGATCFVVGLGLLLAWIEWQEFSSTFIISPDEPLSGIFESMYGSGPWVTIGGWVAMLAGLSLHLTREKSAAVPVTAATTPLSSTD